jgi:Protein of unknown function (DUF2628)
MSTFTVHVPPLRPGESAADPERFVFVRDGFYVWALLLAPLWLLVHRLWIALAGYVALNILTGLVLKLLGAPQGAQFAGGLLIALLVGLEGGTLRRWTLSRRGWKLIGFAVGDDLESAERRFFAAWPQNSAARNAVTPAPLAPEKFAAPGWRAPPAPSDVIGLFPEPERKS